MARPPSSKFVTIEINENLKIRISLPLLVLVTITMALVTLLLPIIALFTVPTYLALLFALSSDRISFGNYESNSSFDEEE